MEWLRLPETSMFSDQFNALEVWNGFNMTDSNGDGIREISRLDVVMRDWFNFNQPHIPVDETFENTEPLTQCHT